MSRAYGPHDAEQAPTTVLVHHTENGRRVEQEVPRVAALLAQRRNLNNRAWKAGQCQSSS